MAIKRGSKVDKSYSAASMTDLMFLLLIFMLISTTLINPNAIKLLLPKSANQLKDKAMTTVSIDRELNLYVEMIPVTYETLEAALRAKLDGAEKPTVSLHLDESVPASEIIKVMNVAKDNKYALIMATRAN